MLSRVKMDAVFTARCYLYAERGIAMAWGRCSVGRGQAMAHPKF